MSQELLHLMSQELLVHLMSQELLHLSTRIATSHVTRIAANGAPGSGPDNDSAKDIC